jgi:plasmid stabilization system protein ParE
LKDLKAIFAWSLAKHPDTTERFASELFDRLDLLAVFPYLGEPIGRKPGVRRLFACAAPCLTIELTIRNKL